MSTDLKLFGKGIQSGLEMAGNKIANEAKKISLDQQIETNKQAFEDRNISRLDQLNQQLASVKASAARRGVTGGTAGITEGLVKKEERATASDLINTLNRERSLIFQQDQLETLEKTQRLGQISGLFSSIAGSGAFTQGG